MSKKWPKGGSPNTLKIRFWYRWRNCTPHKIGYPRQPRGTKCIPAKWSQGRWHIVHCLRCDHVFARKRK